jgi:hypothetical protein
MKGEEFFNNMVGIEVFPQFKVNSLLSKSLFKISINLNFQLPIQIKNP